jgi:hypothetical protein
MLQTVRAGSHFDHKEMEKQRGFLVYVTRTYPALVPYLKGIYLTLDSWRDGRDDEGWRMQGELTAHLQVDHVAPCFASSAPTIVLAVPRLEADLEALTTLMASPTPPECIIRSSRVMVALNGFADASGAGFGSTIAGKNGIFFRYSIWGSDLASCSSNYRELFNLTEAASEHISHLRFQHFKSLVDSISLEASSTSLLRCQFFLFTDNAVAEAAFYKGTSSNRQLFDLVLRLRRLEVDHAFSLHVIHISGRRMQSQGTDSLSRGDLLSGVMHGSPLLDFVPLHLAASTRSTGLIPWCMSWLLPSQTLVPLQPNQWFSLGHGITGWDSNLDGMPMPILVDSSDTVFLWCPPPAAASIALEQLSYSRLKRPHLAHTVICPRVLTSQWRKQLFKLSDLVFTLPAGARPSVWPQDMYEPLIVGLLLPFLPSAPLLRRYTPPIFAVESALSGVWASLQGKRMPYFAATLELDGGGGLRFVLELGVGGATHPRR